MLQMFLSIGAIILLSIGTLAMNRGFEASDRVMRSSKYAIIATSIASSLIEEATGKAFDESSTDKLVWNPADLTPAGKLGLDAGETALTRDDVDDYSGMSRSDTVAIGDASKRIVYTTQCTVTYDDPASPDSPYGSQNWHKKISVTVTSPAMTDTIRQQVLYSYFRFE
jgi:hypothetical protein